MGDAHVLARAPDIALAAVSLAIAAIVVVVFDPSLRGWRRQVATNGFDRDSV
jgi:hypothetical protein